MWEFAATSVDGGPLDLFGVAVWSAGWRRVPGRVAEVRDPLYGQPYRFPVYRAWPGRRSVTFAAGEFSACVWGFFVTRETKARRTRRCSGPAPRRAGS